MLLSLGDGLELNIRLLLKNLYARVFYCSYFHVDRTCDHQFADFIVDEGGDTLYSDDKNPNNYQLWRVTKLNHVAFPHSW